VANYGVTNSTALAGTPQLGIGSSYSNQIIIAASSGTMISPPIAPGLRRGKIYDILVGTNGTPADNFVEWDLCRANVGSTVVWLGSISSVSSGYSLDFPADVGFAAFATINTSAGSSAASIAVAQPWYIGVNQRASYRWVAAPGSEIVYPAVSSASAGNGIALRARSAGYTGTVTGNLMWQEQ
jgi:hypothetical protein